MTKRLFSPIGVPWRIGRKVGRTIYAQTGAEPSDHDPLIGVMDSKALAIEAVQRHNEALGAPSPRQGMRRPGRRS